MGIETGFAEEVAQIASDGRALALARMDSTARIFYATGRGPVNLTTGIQEATYADRIASTPCRFGSQGSSKAGDTTPGQAIGSRVSREVSIPWDSERVYVGDFVELLEVGPLTDESLAGIRWRVVDAGQLSQVTARRLQVEADL